MKRKTWIIGIASLLLGFSSCSKEENTLPEEEGELVAIDIPIGGVVDEEDISLSRGLFVEDTLRQELGDGLIMESVLTSTPQVQTRAAFPGGTFILMIAYKISGSTYTPYRYQKFAPGNKIFLPTGIPLRLVFFSENNNSMVVSNYVTGGVNDTNSHLFDGNTTVKTDVLLSTRATNDPLFARIDNVTVQSGRTISALKFKHLKAKLTWTIESINGSGNLSGGFSGTIGIFYPEAKLKLSNIVNLSSVTATGTWAGNGTTYNDSFSMTTGGTSASGMRILWPTTATQLGYKITNLKFANCGDKNFAASPIEGTVSLSSALQGGKSYTLKSRFYYSKVTFRLRGDNNNDGINTGGNITVYGEKTGAASSKATATVSKWWISGWYRIDKNGKHTKLSSSTVGTGESLSGSTLTVTPNSTNNGNIYEARIVAWAGSNIFWDGNASSGRLIFDIETVTTHQYYEGVYFKWGSLAGHAPHIRWNGNSSYVFLGTATKPTTGSAMPSASGGSTGVFMWNDVPSLCDLDNTVSGWTDINYRSYPYLTDGVTTGSNKGDICKYLSGNGVVAGTWRMPTATDFESWGSGSWSDTSPSGDWIRSSSVTRTNWATTKPSNQFGQGESLNSDGTHAGGVFIPTNTHFPIGNYLLYDGTLPGDSYGNAGHYWCSSHQTSYANLFTFGYDGPSMSSGTNHAYPIRCIREN